MNMYERIKNCEREININYWFIMCMMFLLYFSQCYVINDSVNRLNEHKRLLIAQQEQINKLIINAEYNKIRYEQKQNR